MGTYILKRLLLFLPTLMVVAFLIFLLENGQEKDAIYTQLVHDGVYSTDFENLSDKQHFDIQYNIKVAGQKYNLPDFYISILPDCISDTIDRILPIAQRKSLFKLACETQDWNAVTQIRTSVQLRQSEALANKNSTQSERKIKNGFCMKLLEAESTLQLQQISNDIRQQRLDTFFHSELQNIEKMVPSKQPSLRYRLVLNGFNCRFHHFLKGFLTFDFGTSITDSRSVLQKIIDNGKITLLLNSIALLLVILLSIWLAKIAFYHHNKLKDRIIQGVTLALHSVPVFWAGTMLILFLTNDDYGINLFPASGFGSPVASDTFFSRLADYLPYMVLPVICLVYTHIAFYSRQLRSSLLEVSRQDYIRTAKAKGLSEKQIFKKHLFPNALFPLITLIGSLIPALITGSVIVETLFSIPGMGNLTIKSIQSKDWNVVNAIVWISAILSMLGILVSDVLYRWADPRVRMD